MSDLLSTASTARVPIREARLLAASRAAESGELAALSEERFFALWERFERFAAKFDGITMVGDISPAVVEAFFAAPTRTGSVSVATRHLRRASLRMLFRTWRQFGLIDFEPTLDNVLPSRSQPTYRILSDEEVERCRWASLATLVRTRQPTIWALAEAGLRPTEIALVTAADVSIDATVVSAPGTDKVRSRRVGLTDWGQAQVRRRVAASPLHGHLVVPEGTSAASARTSVAATLRTILQRAGVVSDDIALRSIVGWAGARILVQTGSIESAARSLGMTSLDRAAEVVGHRWATS